MEVSKVSFIEPMNKLQLLESDRYRCCCNCMTVCHGAVIFCMIEILESMLQIGRCIWFDRTIGLPANAYPSLAIAVLTVVMAILVLIGIKKENKMFIFPHLVWFAISYFSRTFFFIQTWAVDISAINEKEKIAMEKYTATENGKVLQSSTVTTVWVSFAVVSLILAGVYIWMFRVLYKLYRYYEAKRNIIEGSPFIPCNELHAITITPGFYSSRKLKTNMDTPQKFF